MQPNLRTKIKTFVNNYTNFD